MITVSVPGKIHLMGEHAVVYGKPALLTAINKRMKVSVEKAKYTEIITTEPPTYVAFALTKIQEHLKRDELPPMRISIDSDIPSGYHLGSSAATAVGVIGAVIYFLTHIWNLSEINALAYEVEKKQHGNPSGGDNTIVTYGGLLWFRKEMEFLKSMQQMDISIPSALNHFYLINTGKPNETTGEMVAYVKNQYTRFTTRYARLFDENEQQTKNITLSLKEKDERKCIESMRLGQQTLEKIGVVGKKVMPIIRAIEDSGGAAKILGGGGRCEGVGYLLCYHKDQDVVRSISNTYVYACEKISLGAEGVKLEKRSNI